MDSPSPHPHSSLPKTSSSRDLQSHAVTPSPPRPFRSSSFTSSGIPLSPIISPVRSPSPSHAHVYTKPMTPGPSGTSGNAVSPLPSTPTPANSQYTHPYRIQTSASSILTRSNSSNHQPLSGVLSPPTSSSSSSAGYGYGSWGYQSPALSTSPSAQASGGHRPSKSMSNLRTSASVDDLSSRINGGGAAHSKSNSAGQQGLAFPTSASSGNLATPSSPLPLTGSPLAGDAGTGTIRQLGAGRRYNSLSGNVVRPLVAQWTGESQKGGDGGRERDMDATIKPSPRRVEMKLWQNGDEDGQKGKSKVAAEEQERNRIAALPPNPKAWTPSELATYISVSLTHGISPNESNPSSSSSLKALPKAVVKDIENWVLRHRLDGKSFLRGGEGTWANSAAKPPPFLPVLLSLSRNLRRASLKGNVLSQALFDAASSGNIPDPAGPSHKRDDSLHSRISSVLHEESGEDSGNTSALTDAEDDDEDGEPAEWNMSEFSKVRRLIGDFDTKSVSGSEVSEGHEARRTPRTRSSSISSTRSFASSIGERVEMLETAMAHRKVDSMDKGPARPLTKAALEQFSAQVAKQEEAKAAAVPTQGLSLVGLGISHEDSISNIQHTPMTDMQSPPPAYASPNPNMDIDREPVATVLHPAPSPARSTQSARSDHSTPRKETQRRQQHQGPWEQEATHMSHMIEHAQQGARPYGALRRTNSSGSNSEGPRLPASKILGPPPSPGLLAPPFPDREGSPEDDDDPRNTARRVTIRPARKVTEVFSEVDMPRSPARATRDLALETAEQVKVKKMLTEMAERLQAAESRIIELESEKVARERASMPFANLPFSDKLPQSIRELPSYVAFVGLGLGFVVFQTLLRRSARA